jgi:hypothetical protein
VQLAVAASELRVCTLQLVVHVRSRIQTVVANLDELMRQDMLQQSLKKDDRCERTETRCSMLCSSRKRRTNHQPARRTCFPGRRAPGSAAAVEIAASPTSFTIR